MVSYVNNFSDTLAPTFWSTIRRFEKTFLAQSDAEALQRHSATWGSNRYNLHNHRKHDGQAAS